MKRTFEGIVVSNKMAKTVVVDVTSRTAHPIYKKLIKREKKIKADTSRSLKVGDKVLIVETKPISKDKHFKIMEVIKSGSA